MYEFFHGHIGEFSALSTAVFWTLSALAWTSAGRQVGALSVSFIRLVIAFVLLTITCKIAHGLWWPSDADARTWTILLISGFFGFFLADLCIFKAFIIIGPRLTLLLQAFTPPLAAMLSHWYLGDTLGTKKWLAMAVTLAGVVWVVLERQESPKEMHHRKDFTWGVLLAIGSAVFTAFGQVFSRQGIHHPNGSNYDPFAATLIRVIGAFACYLVLLFVMRRWRQIGRTTQHGRAMVIIALGAVVGPYLGVAMNMKALATCSTGVVTTIISTTPVLILPLVILLYKEKVSPRAAIGAGISVLGVALLMI
jgi:drug/metabolite transporter (DMT)-like permease